MFLVALIVSSFLHLISKQARRNAAVSVLLLKKNDIFYPIFQPRPQGAFPWPTSYKAREKRPGDEVADLQQNSPSIFALLWVDTNTLLIY